MSDTPVKLRFCTYCRCDRPVDDFKPVLDPKTGRLVNHKCSFCRKWKKAPVKVRDKRGEEVRRLNSEAEARRQAHYQQAMKEQLAQRVNADRERSEHKVRPLHKRDGEIDPQENK